MPTLRCVCGHVLAAQHDYQPYRGQFFASADDPDTERIVDALAQFISEQEYGADDAEKQGDGEIGRPAPQNDLDSGILTCESCGRVWMRTAPQAGGKYLF